MTWQSNSISPTSTSPSTDIGKIKNDLAQLKAVLGGGTDGDIPVTPKTNGVKFGQLDSTDGLTLNWYQQGSFTPTLLMSGTPTYVAREAFYTRIGRVVTFYARIVWSGGGAGAITGVNGLPFNGVSGIGQPVSLRPNEFGTLTFSGTPYAYVSGVAVYLNTAGSYSGTTSPPGSISNNTTAGSNCIIVGGSYTVGD